MASWYHNLWVVVCWGVSCAVAACVLWPVGVSYAVQPVCCGLLGQLCSTACVLWSVGVSYAVQPACCLVAGAVVRAVVQPVCCGLSGQVQYSLCAVARWVAKLGYSKCALYGQSAKYSMRSLLHEQPSWLSIACGLWPIKWPVGG